MKVSLEGKLFEWRGPSPFYFVQVPENQAKKIKLISKQLTYGWGVIPVAGRIGKTKFTTALIPKDGSYRVPIKNAVRFAENLELDQLVKVNLTFGE